MIIYECTRRDRRQILCCLDLQDDAAIDIYRSLLLPEHVAAVYSDPPWNPGNATYWRTHAGREPCESYDALLDAWVSVSVECLNRGARHIFNEQSSNEKHCGMFIDAVKRNSDWSLPLLEKWEVFYGSPGSQSCRRPNALLHFGHERITTNPAGMHGEPMTIRVCAGLGLPVGSWIVDQCTGKGMSSRMAHYFDWNYVGSELNPRRLAKTLEWLKKQGYEIHEQTA